MRCHTEQPLGVFRLDRGDANQAVRNQSLSTHVPHGEPWWLSVRSPIGTQLQRLDAVTPFLNVFSRLAVTIAFLVFANALPRTTHRLAWCRFRHISRASVPYERQLNALRPFGVHLRAHDAIAAPIQGLSQVGKLTYGEVAAVPAKTNGLFASLVV